MVILELKRFFRSLRPVRAELGVRCIADQLFMILHQHAVLKNRCVSRLRQLVSFKARSLEHNIVRLPFAGLLRDAFTSGGYWPYMAAACPSA